MSYDLQNTLKQAAATRQRDQMQRVAAEGATPREVGRLAGRVSSRTPVQPGVDSQITELDDQTAGRYLGLCRLEDLTTQHMTAAQAAWYHQLLADVRAWRELVRREPGKALIFTSPQYGIGKTHVAKALLASFCNIAYPHKPLTLTQRYEHGEPIGKPVPNFHLEARGVLYEAPDLMRAVGDIGKKKDDYTIQMTSIVKPEHELLVIDEVGREGWLEYVPKEHQELEIRDRYFRVINFCYERIKRGQPINLVLTANKNLNELRLFFNAATWSRLSELCPSGYGIQPSLELPDMREILGGRT